MSLSELTKDVYKPWLNARVNNLIVDGSLSYNNPSITTTVAFQYDGSGTFPVDVTLRISKFGNSVTILIPSFTENPVNGSNQCDSTALPAEYIPTHGTGICGNLSVFNLSNYYPCVIFVTTGGIIRIERIDHTNFPNNIPLTSEAVTINYLIGS